VDPVTVQVPAHMQFLAPWDCEVVRVGSLHDGGYVVGVKSLHDANSLLSLGIASEWSFDSDFLSRRPNISYLACDRSSGSVVHLVGALRCMASLTTITNVFKLLKRAASFVKLVPPVSVTRRRRFVRKWVRASVVNAKTEVSFRDLVEAHQDARPTFLKMDIEGGEYEVLAHIATVSQLSPETFCGMCIEFHEVANRFAEVREFLKQLEPCFSIIHVHANNYAPLVDGFPDAMEITLARRPDVGPTRLVVLPRPGLDAPNSSSKPDFVLKFESS